jgi:aspartyl/glutamyl-tRNA(Asn/Gln) amidotransferase C subunit
MINKEEINKLADLVRLSLSAEEAEQIGQDEALILDYIDRLKELNLESIKAEEIKTEAFLRADKPLSFSDANLLRDAFPSIQERLLKVPFIFEKND